MLDSLRAFSKTWVSKILLAVLVVSFAAFGINNVITNLGTNTIAAVGDQEIKVNEFQRAYNQQLNSAAQQLGSVPTGQDALALGIPSSVIQQLANQAAVDRMAQQLGLGVSEDRLGQMLREDPSFSGTLGAFNPENFEAVLRQSGYTEAEYLEIQARASRRQQIAQALFVDAVIPETAHQLINRYSADTRTVEYFVLNETSIPAVPEPTEEELAAYLAEHQAEFRTVETRTVDLLTLSPESLAASKTISEGAIAAEYERTRASLVRPERRTIQQVSLPVEGLVVAFETGKAEGRSFTDLVAQAGEQVTELGTLTREQVTDPTLAETAFGLAQGDFAIIEGIGSKRAVHVSAIEPGGEIPLEQARADITNRLSLAEARNEYAEILDQIEELRAAFQPMQQIAERFKLPLNTVAVSASGAELAELTDIPEDARTRVAEAVFAAEQGQLAPAITLSGSRTTWFDLKSVEPARDQTLEEVRDPVLAAVAAERTEQAIAAEVEKALEQLRTGTAFADVAASLNQFPQLSQPMTRTGDGTTMLNATVGSAVFAGGPGHFGSAPNNEGGQVVFQVVDILPASGSTTGQGREFVANSARDSLYNEFVAGLVDEAGGIRVNQQVLSQVLALDTGT